MRKVILISPNSFKESATSIQIAEYFNEFLSGDYFKTLKPISDGGDGFLDVCKFYLGGELLDYEISTPYSEEKFECKVLYVPDQKMINIESANVLGLKVIPVEKRKPLFLSSKGMGELLLLLNNDVGTGKLDVSEVNIGIGGTGTIDMGIGACSQLGLKIRNNSNKILNTIPINFVEARTLTFNNPELPFNIKCIVDVNTFLLGDDGAIHLFGSQKGASMKDLKLIDDGLYNIINLLKIKGIRLLPNKINGAGGGLATGLQILLNSKIIQANEFIHNTILDLNSESIDSVITGEGAFDSQSLKGKGANVIINRFKNSGKQLYLVCGIVENSVIPKLPENVIVIELSKFFNSKEESIKNIKEGIRLASVEINKQIN